MTLLQKVKTYAPTLSPSTLPKQQRVCHGNVERQQWDIVNQDVNPPINKYINDLIGLLF